MSMTVDVNVNGELITRLSISTITGLSSGINTYRWIYSRHDLGSIRSLLSLQEGTIEHRYEDGAMALISKVAQAASESETP